MQSKSNSYEKNIKQFNSIQTHERIWKKMDNTKISLKDDSKDVYIPNDIIVNGTIQNPSDKRLKTEIEDLSDSDIDKLNKLTPVKYIYKKDHMNRKHFGLIAQDVERQFPNLVRMDESTNFKSVNYLEFIPLLLKKINRLETEINELKQSI